MNRRLLSSLAVVLALGCNGASEPEPLASTSLALTAEEEMALVPYASAASQTQMRGPVTAATDAGFFVAWNEVDLDGGIRGVAVVAIDASGQVIGSPQSLNVGIAPEHGVSLATTGDGTVAAWVCGAPSRLCARRVEVSSLGPGGAVTSPIFANDESALGGSTGDAVLAWADQRVGTQWNIYACVLGAANTCTPTDGVAVRPQPTVAEYTARATASADSSEFVIAWYDVTSGADVLLQRLSTGGALVGTRGNLASSPAANADLAVTHAWTTGYWLAWEDAVISRESNGSPGAYGRRPDDAKLAFVRICSHYFAHDAFLEDGVLIREAGQLAGIPGVLIHGRDDLGGGACTPWELARAWPGAELIIIEDSGHTGSTTMTGQMHAAADRLYEHITSSG